MLRLAYPVLILLASRQINLDVQSDKSRDGGRRGGGRMSFYRRMRRTLPICKRNIRKREREKVKREAGKGGGKHAHMQSFPKCPSTSQFAHTNKNSSHRSNR
ncbi:hypothetical protein F4810DRAFT_461090 [Camillea tinctor]|nr:hypothetical protein F4810DRAFT_461090 [Camillea tinctor]